MSTSGDPQNIPIVLPILSTAVVLNGRLWLDGESSVSETRCFVWSGILPRGRRCPEVSSHLAFRSSRREADTGLTGQAVKLPKLGSKRHSLNRPRPDAAPQKSSEPPEARLPDSAREDCRSPFHRHSVVPLAR